MIDTENTEKSMEHHLGINEYLTSCQLAQHCCKPEHEINAILEIWEDLGLVARVEEEYCLTR